MRIGFNIVDEALAPAKRENLQERAFVAWFNGEIIDQLSNGRFHGEHKKRPLFILKGGTHNLRACPCSSQVDKRHKYSRIRAGVVLESVQPHAIPKDTDILHIFNFVVPNNWEFLEYWGKLSIKGVVPENGIDGNQWKLFSSSCSR